MNNLRVAIVHDFLFQFGGGEKVVEKWLEMYPNADVYTSFAIPEKFKSSQIITKAFTDGRIKTTWIQKLFDLRNKNGARFLAKYEKHLFWLYPFFMRFTTVKDYYLVLIFSTDCAKQVRFNNCHKIIHYCNTPTRYLHNLVTKADQKSLSKIYKLLLPLFILFLKPLDLSAVEYLNSKGAMWYGNSENIQAVIWDKYKTRSEVLYPPVETLRFASIKRNPKPAEEFYLSHGRISFHKRLDLAIMACLELGKKLKISGTSGLPKEMVDLKKIVTDFEQLNPDKVGLIEFLGRTTDEQLYDLVANCKAFLFPGKEDFGIAPVEIMSAGVPVIAYGAGGALEYVINNQTGITFGEQTVESICAAIAEFESKSNWSSNDIKKFAQKFDEKLFTIRVKEIAGF